MKCISLTQPWASLVACGAKLYETRSWYTPYRGPIAIHAAKGFPVDARYTALLPPFADVLRKAGYRIEALPSKRTACKLFHTLPLGMVVATARLETLLETEIIRPHVSDQERCFGNYASGRWAWALTDIEPLAEPVPAVGALGLWEWQS